MKPVLLVLGLLLATVPAYARSGPWVGGGDTDIFTGGVAMPILSATLGGIVGAAAGAKLSPDDLCDLRGMTHDRLRASVEYLIPHD